MILGLWCQFGEALGPDLRPRGNVAKSERSVASKCEALASLVLPLGALGRPFAARDSKKSTQMCKKTIWGHRENVGFPLCFCCFQRLAGPNGAPHDGLEASWGELGETFSDV